MALSFDRRAVEMFLEANNHTNFEIIARGKGFEGATAPSIVKETRLFGNASQTEVKARYSGRMPAGQSRQFSQAYNAAQAGDFIGALETLIDSYFDQVELRPLPAVDTPNQNSLPSSQHNPLADTLESFIWVRDAESGKIVGHGGARQGAGRPSLKGKPVLVDMPDELIDALQDEASRRGVKRAELIRDLIQKGLES